MNKHRIKKPNCLCGSKHSFIVHLLFLYWYLHHFIDKLREYCYTGYLGTTGLILRSFFFSGMGAAKHGLADANKSYLSFKRFQISPKRDTLLPVWAASASVWWPSQCLLMMRWSLSCLCGSCPLHLILSLGITENKLKPSPLCPPFRYLHTLMRSPVSFFFFRLKCSISLSLSINASMTTWHLS